MNVSPSLYDGRSCNLQLTLLRHVSAVRGNILEDVEQHRAIIDMNLTRQTYIQSLCLVVFEMFLIDFGRLGIGIRLERKPDLPED